MLKRIIGKKKILLLILGIIVGILISVVGVYAATLIDSTNVTYDNSKSKLESTNVQDAIDELYSKVNTGAQYIINIYNKAEKTTLITAGKETIVQAKKVNLMTDSVGALRYYGKNPNNYVTFNNEKDKWRIIGVFNVNSDNKVEHRIKIIRDYIDIRQYNTVSNINDWTKSSIKDYLNNNYYSTLTSEAKKMIDNTIWYLGGAGYTEGSVSNYQNLYADDWRNQERNAEVYNGNSTTWFGKIGLIYPSDYAYAVDLSTCNQTFYNYNNNSNCNDNFFYNGTSYLWTISPTSLTTNNIFYISAANSNILYMNVTNGAEIRPTLYLKQNVIIIGGDGSYNNPYQLSIKE